jgi:hypothetical protein
VLVQSWLPGDCCDAYRRPLRPQIVQPEICPACRRLRQSPAALRSWPAYCQRWEEETGNDQLKTCLRGPGAVLRSKSPDMVRQEIYGDLLTYYAISALICRASTEADRTTSWELPRPRRHHPPRLRCLSRAERRMDPSSPLHGTADPRRYMGLQILAACHMPSSHRETAESGVITESVSA